MRQCRESLPKYISCYLNNVITTGKELKAWRLFGAVYQKTYAAETTRKMLHYRPMLHMTTTVPYLRISHNCASEAPVPRAAKRAVLFILACVPYREEESSLTSSEMRSFRCQ